MHSIYGHISRYQDNWVVSGMFIFTLYLTLELVLNVVSPALLFTYQHLTIDSTCQSKQQHQISCNLLEVHLISLAPATGAFNDL